MRRILVTGMSGTGKSTVLAGLSDRGIAVVDIEDEWCVTQPDGTRLWDIPAVSRVLDDESRDPLVLAGCEANMRELLPRFDEVVLLSVPWDVLDARLATRTTNDFGRSPDERTKVRTDLEAVEPLLRSVATVEIDTRAPIEDIVEQVMAVAGGDRP